MIFLIANPTAQSETRFPAIPDDQIIDRSHFSRHRKEDVEVAIIQAASHGLITFYLDGRPVAKAAGGQAIILFLSPGRHRLGVEPTYNFGRAGLQQVDAEITHEPRQFYRIFQSSGFTSSGGNAVYEIAPLKNPH